MGDLAAHSSLLSSEVTAFGVGVGISVGRGVGRGICVGAAVAAGIGVGFRGGVVVAIGATFGLGPSALGDSESFLPDPPRLRTNTTPRMPTREAVRSAKGGAYPSE